MTLTEASYYSRRFAPFLVLFVVVILIVFYLFKVVMLYLSLNQHQELYFNTIFNEMNPLKVSEASSSANHNYFMDTVEGEPITATEAARVFFLPQSKFSFGYQQKIALMAKNLGFDPSVKYNLVDKTQAEYTDKKRTLKVDITNFNFKFDTNIQNSPELFTNNGIPDKEDAQNRAIDFLKSNDRYPDDLAQGRTNIIYLQYDKVSSRTAVLQDVQGANMVEVDFYRADIDQFPIVSPHYFNSQNYVTMVYNDGIYTVVSAQVMFFERSMEEVGLYPVMDGKTAFEKLATGSGYIVSGQTSKRDIPIKRMFLGYYDTDIYQQHMMPVYVFLGDENFVAYVPAITDRWIIDVSKL